MFLLRSQNADVTCGHPNPVLILLSLFSEWMVSVFSRRRENKEAALVWAAKGDERLRGLGG